MMRTTELLQFAEKHDLTVITITDIIEYRLKNESLIRREAEQNSRQNMVTLRFMDMKIF